MTLWYRSIHPGSQWVKLLATRTMMLVLGRSLPAASRRDPDIRQEIQAWNRGFTALLTISPRGPSLGMEKTGQGLSSRRKDLDTADLELQFKSLACAFRVMTGKMTLGQAIIENRIRIRGDMVQAVVLARILTILVACLLPLAEDKTWSNRYSGTGKTRLGLRIWLYSFGILLGK